MMMQVITHTIFEDYISKCLIIFHVLSIQATAWEQIAMKKVDNLLESFLGIRDEELGM
jgi:hypothetical protein